MISRLTKEESFRILEGVAFYRELNGWKNSGNLEGVYTLSFSGFLPKYEKSF